MRRSRARMIAAGLLPALLLAACGSAADQAKVHKLAALVGELASAGR